MMWQLQLVHLVKQQQPVKSASSSIKQSSSSRLNSSSSKLNSTSSSNLCSRKQELGKPGPPRRERLPSHPVPLLYLTLCLNMMPPLMPPSTVEPDSSGIPPPPPWSQYFPTESDRLLCKICLIKSYQFSRFSDSCMSCFLKTYRPR